LKLVVVDASITLAAYLPDEHSLATQDFFASLDGREVHAPVIWPLEVANGLLVACHRRRLSAEDANATWEALHAYGFSIEVQSDANRVPHLLSLARRYDLSAYDASYLELALRLSGGLATLDAKLSRAASLAGLPLAVDR
jgi:predicted nucleic acid-binding protein